MKLVKDAFRASIFAMAATALVAPASAATLFDMEGLTNGERPNVVLTEGGVTLTVTTQSDPSGRIVATDPSVALLGSRSIVGLNSGGGFASLRYSFNVIINSITFAFGDAGGEDDTPVIISAFDAANSLLGSMSATYPQGFGAGKSLTLDFQGARSFTIASGTIGNNPNSVFSEITSYETAGAVPEPATWMMMLLGLAGVGFSMRRRDQQTLRIRYT